MTAQCSGAAPSHSPFQEFTLAPASTSILTILVLPALTAACKGVLPDSVDRLFTSKLVQSYRKKEIVRIIVL